MMTIGHISIGSDHPPFIVAELSANHCGDETLAKELIAAAKACGADAVKLQTYRADTLTVNVEKDFYYIRKGPWAGRYMFDLYRKGELDWEIQARLFEYARAIGILCFSSPFDASAVDFLEEVGCLAYKIASPEIVDGPLLDRVGRTGKPVIVSNGAASVAEIQWALDRLHAAGMCEVALLHCTSTYPAPPDAINLRTIPHMQQLFGVPVGLSDHTMGSAVAIGAVALGASMVEKHFVLRRESESIDAFFSATPDELEALVRGCRDVYAARGEVHYAAHAPAPQKSIIVVAPIRKGEPFTPENVKVLRPGGGMHPKHYDTILGRVACRDLAYGDVLGFEDVGGIDGSC